MGVKSKGILYKDLKAMEKIILLYVSGNLSEKSCIKF